MLAAVMAFVSSSLLMLAYRRAETAGVCDLARCLPSLDLVDVLPR